MAALDAGVVLSLHAGFRGALRSDLATDSCWHEGLRQGEYCQTSSLHRATLRVERFLGSPHD